MPVTQGNVAWSGPYNVTVIQAYGQLDGNSLSHGDVSNLTISTSGDSAMFAGFAWNWVHELSFSEEKFGSTLYCYNKYMTFSTIHSLRCTRDTEIAAFSADDMCRVQTFQANIIDKDVIISLWGVRI